jgi:translin
MTSSNLYSIGEGILARLESKHAQRERVLAGSRRLVQHSAKAIRAVHRREWDVAEDILRDAAELLAEMHVAARGHGDLMTAGYTLDAQKEFSEAHLTRALVRGDALPAPEDLGVADAAWLNGLGEAGGELRRVALDMIRRGEISEAETVLEQMQEIYVFLSTVDFPDAITRGIKRTNDMVRGVTERTRGDLTVAARQEELKMALDRFEDRVGRREGEPPSAGDTASR